MSAPITICREIFCKMVIKIQENGNLYVWPEQNYYYYTYIYIYINLHRTKMADDGDLNDDGGVVPGLLEWAVSSASE